MNTLRTDILNSIQAILTEKKIQCFMQVDIPRKDSVDINWYEGSVFIKKIPSRYKFLFDFSFERRYFSICFPDKEFLNVNYEDEDSINKIYKYVDRSYIVSCMIPPDEEYDLWYL